MQRLRRVILNPVFSRQLGGLVANTYNWDFFAVMPGHITHRIMCVRFLFNKRAMYSGISRRFHFSAQIGMAPEEIFVLGPAYNIYRKVAGCSTRAKPLLRVLRANFLHRRLQRWPRAALLLAPSISIGENNHFNTQHWHDWFPYNLILVFERSTHIRHERRPWVRWLGAFINIQYKHWLWRESKVSWTRKKCDYVLRAIICQLNVPETFWNVSGGNYDVGEDSCTPQAIGQLSIMQRS